MVVGFTRAIVTDRTPAGKTPAGDKPRTAAHRKAGTVARIVVDVMLRREIHDPQGEAIASACQRLGFGQVLGVRQGKRFEVELSGPADEAALVKVAELAGELLANPVIEEFTLREG
jgi:phosphoribosylformylglycinamidine synthase subunit PurS